MQWADGSMLAQAASLQRFCTQMVSTCTGCSCLQHELHSPCRAGPCCTTTPCAVWPARGAHGPSRLAPCLIRADCGSQRRARRQHCSVGSCTPRQQCMQHCVQGFRTMPANSSLSSCYRQQEQRAQQQPGQRAAQRRIWCRNGWRHGSTPAEDGVIAAAGALRRRGRRHINQRPAPRRRCHQPQLSGQR